MLAGALHLSPGYFVGHEHHPVVDIGRFRFPEPASLGDRKLVRNPDSEIRINRLAQGHYSDNDDEAEGEKQSGKYIKPDC